MKEALSYDDVLIVPQKSEVDSRDDVSLETRVTPNNQIDVPLVSAPMDSVTGPELAQEMTSNGGVGILHRTEPPDADYFYEERCDWIRSVDGVVGASVGVGGKHLQNAIQFDQAGVDFICIDIAHGHLEKMLEFVSLVSRAVDVDVMVGNVATWTAARDLIKAGADSIKIGIGPGSHCTTREKTGVGVPQFTAVRQITNQYSRWQGEQDVTFIADGGITKPGDAAKALMAGADAVMMGGIFGRCDESPAGREVWGMASQKAKDKQDIDGYVEGVSSEAEYEESEKSVAGVFIDFEDGLRSALSYCGGHTIENARDGVEFVKTTPSVRSRNGGYAKDFY